MDILFIDSDGGLWKPQNLGIKKKKLFENKELLPNFYFGKVGEGRKEALN